MLSSVHQVCARLPAKFDEALADAAKVVELNEEAGFQADNLLWATTPCITPIPSYVSQKVPALFGETPVRPPKRSGQTLAAETG